MIHTILADTGPLYAAVDPDDQYHRRAQRELGRVQAEGWQTAVVYPTLFEAYTLVMQRLGIPVAHRWLDEITGAVTLPTPTAEDFVRALERLHAYRDQRLTLTDTMLATVSIRLACPVWTYDHHFDLLQVTVWR